YKIGPELFEDVADERELPLDHPRWLRIVGENPPRQAVNWPVVELTTQAASDHPFAGKDNPVARQTGGALAILHERAHLRGMSRIRFPRSTLAEIRDHEEIGFAAE